VLLVRGIALLKFFAICCARLSAIIRRINHFRCLCGILPDEGVVRGKSALQTVGHAAFGRFGI
jgi:hypothetical protein